MSHADRCVAVQVEPGDEPYDFQVDTYASIDDGVATALGLQALRTTGSSDGRTERTRVERGELS
jgi:hypothetical protein